MIATARRLVAASIIAAALSALSVLGAQAASAATIHPTTTVTAAAPADTPWCPTTPTC